MHAIGNQILSYNSNAKVLYVTSENFTNQLINALKDQATEKFREKYRNIDVLLIDDIQFIANKKSTQEEFFHTFNTLYESGKQIVLSSDKPPKDIELLEDRLKSRFEWGLIADISNPDYETRLAILRKKTQLDNIIIDDEILSAIATRVDSNIRELEGTLNKLIAKASLTNSPITMEMTEKAINDIVAQQDKVISSEYIQDVVGKYFNVSPQDLRGAKRSNDVTFPRQIAMYLCRNVAQMSLPQIGIDFGKRDHTTVMHGCNKIEKEIKENKNYYQYVVAGKTGYTSNALSTLITLADNGNMKLVCVVLRTHGVNIYPDTKNLFEYAFNNFQKIQVADEKKPTEVKEFITASDESEDAGSAQTGGNEYQPLEDGYVILPKDVSYKDIDYEITDVDEDTGEGTIRYIYDGHQVGSATAEFTDKYLQKVSTRKERVDSKPKDVDNSGDSKKNGGKSSAKSIWKNFLQKVEAVWDFGQKKFAGKSSTEKYMIAGGCVALVILIFSLIVLLIRRRR